jgi:hypothetical protein
MLDTDRKDFAELIAAVYAYHRTQVSPAVIAMYWNGCQRWTLEQVRHAIDVLTQDPEAGKWIPKIGDITRVLEGTSTQRAAIAWGRVHDAMARVGAYQDVDFGDPAIHAAIQDLGGWPKLCRADARELGFMQHRFGEAFRAYSERGAPSAPRALMGDRSPDAEYAKRGLPAPEPVRWTAAPAALLPRVQNLLEGTTS